MTDHRMLLVPSNRVAAVARLLHRSVATDTTEIRRLTTLATAYFDRPAGRSVDAELQLANQQRDAATELLEQLEPKPSA